MTLHGLVVACGNSDRSPAALGYVREVAWGMREASICGLGQAASLPLTSAMRYFPKEFGLEA